MAIERRTNKRQPDRLTSRNTHDVRWWN